MFLSLVCVSFFTAAVSGFTWLSSDLGNYTLLCDQEKEFRCSCPKDDTSSIFDCSSKRIENLPNDVKFPSSITDVLFARNKLTAVPSTVFAEGIKVGYLDLSHNKIKSVASSAFANLYDLKTVDLSHNDIWSLSVDTFANLKNIEKLNLAYNKIGDVLTGVFEPCTSLAEISLKENPLAYLYKDTFSSLPGLRVLDMSSCGLSLLPEDVFQKNTKLDKLKLAANNFPEVPSAGLKSAASLEELDISENPIGNLPSRAFEGLGKLKVLMVTHMSKLTALDPYSLTGLDSLRDLVLTDNLRLTKISESTFKKVPKLLPDGKSDESSEDDEDENKKKVPLSLEKLVLRHNNLQSVPEGLVDWKQLRELDLRENPWLCDCHLAWVAEEKIPDSAKKDAKCSSPSRLSGRALTSLGETDYSCSYLTSEAVIALSILVVAAFVLALVGVSYLLYKRSSISCRKKGTQHRYARVVADKEKVDLEWDHTGEPESRA